MPEFHAPLDDYRFMLLEVLKVEQYRDALAPYKDVDAGLIDALTAEGERLCKDVLFPLNQSGDKEGASIKNGVVFTPKGFKEAYRAYCDGGWAGFSCKAEYGGQGLPEALNMPITEMICSANLAFGITPALTHGAYNALYLHGSDALKQEYLPKLASGEHTGTMCLTEAHCGTDLGLIRTTATPREGGGYLVNGNKMFISGGDHDWTDNIVHMVLAKLPDAPEGSKGISLFLVTKYANEKPNGVTCVSLEEKMGIHASPTCVMEFKNAVGHLVGKPHEGLKAMFTMMNEARIYVGVQGLGLAEIARRQAVAYAKERLQGRGLDGVKNPDKKADPITAHPDVRRMLLTMRSFCESARMLALYAALRVDISKHHSDEKTQRRSDDFIQFATPVIKAYMTDMGFECANLAMQVFGGHGYVREYGVEQYVRDARIAQIYEGANGIQALDLVGRKLVKSGGRYLRPFFHDAAAFVEEHRDHATLRRFTKPMYGALKSARQASMLIAMRAISDPYEAGAASYDYMRLIGCTLHGYMYCLMAKAACEAKDKGGAFSAEYYDDKIAVGRFFMDKILPEHHSLLAKIAAGGESLRVREGAL
ncbi:MAG: acyl-CoA dehydrogenase family protein [Rickettsiales bacterium]